MTGRRRRRAFTLLELLLALSISGLVAVSLFTSMSIAFRARRQAQADLEPSRNAELAMQILREDLESALPPRGSLASAFWSEDLVDDRGLDADDVNFSAATPGPLHQTGTGDVKRVVLAVLKLQDSGEHVLVRRVYGNLLSPVLLEPDDEVLCRHVGSFNLRFFDGTLWWDLWDATLEGDEVPVAVEVTLELEPTGGDSNAPWPRFVRVIQLSCANQGPADEDAGDKSSTSGSDSSQPGGNPTGGQPGNTGPGGQRGGM